MDSLLTALDENTKQCPNLKLCQDVYEYETCVKNKEMNRAETIKEVILEQVFEDNMAPFYDHLCGKFDWGVDKEKLKCMR